MKGLLVFAFLVFISSVAFASTVKEESFKEMGFEGLDIEGVNASDCREVIFFSDLKLLVPENFFILSLHSQFLPVAKGKEAGIQIFLNDNNSALKEMLAKDVKSEWIRVFLPREELKESNKLKLCAKTSNTVTKISILDDSMVGAYKTAFFEEGALKERVSNIHPLLKEELKITVSLKNSGSEKTVVEIKEKEPLLARDDLTFIKGQREFAGEIEPGEEKEIKLEYFIRVEDLRTRVLTAMEATYTNEFGEKETIYSNYPEVVPVEPEKLQPSILLQNPVNPIGGKTKGILLVSNNSVNPLYNVLVEVNAPEGLIESGSGKQLIDVIQPKESRGIEFTLSSAEEGNYEIGCTASYLDINAFESKCSGTEVVFEKEKANFGLSAGIAMLIVGIIIYLYIYFR